MSCEKNDGISNKRKANKKIHRQKKNSKNYEEHLPQCNKCRNKILTIKIYIFFACSNKTDFEAEKREAILS